jgi:hypothetical protein
MAKATSARKPPKGWVRGTITGWGSSWLSGLGWLLIDGRQVACNNTQTVRALDACFGNVITEDHQVNQEAIVGKEIYYGLDDLGLLVGFVPVGVEP